MPDRRVIYDGLSRLTSPCTYAYSVKVLFHSRMECRLHAREKTTGFSVWRKRIDPARKVCKFEREANRYTPLTRLVHRPRRSRLPPPTPSRLSQPRYVPGRTDCQTENSLTNANELTLWTNLIKLCTRN